MPATRRHKVSMTRAGAFLTPFHRSSLEDDGTQPSKSATLTDKVSSPIDASSGRQTEAKAEKKRRVHNKLQNFPIVVNTLDFNDCFALSVSRASMNMTGMGLWTHEIPLVMFARGGIADNNPSFVSVPINGSA